jgi:membrane-associated phospholipid phosphatase
MTSTVFKILLPLFLTSTICFGQESFPYQRNKKDFVLLPVGILTEVSNELLGRKKDHNLSLSEIENLKKANINGFDRGATYNWSTSAQDFSDVPFKVMPLLPIALFIPQVKNKNWDNTFTLGLMYVETFLFTKGITGITKSLVGRTRPYLYNTSFTAEERFLLQGNDGPTASTSFFSGHSSTVFASAVFLSKTFADIYGKSVWSKLIWGSTLTLATATAYARVKGGVHFPTDVIVGAVAGSAIGYAIPALHKKKTNDLSISVIPNGISISLKL